MYSKDLSLLRKEVSKTIAKENLNILFIFDFDGTLIDTFNSVLQPLCKDLGVDLGSYKDFSNKRGSFRKYCMVKNHFFSNIKQFSRVKNKYFQRLLKDYYLKFSKEIKEMKSFSNNLKDLPNVKVEVVSRNYVGDSFNPEEMIREVLSSLSFFDKQDFYVKRVRPVKKKTFFFKELRKEYPNYHIISIGDQIDDYTSALNANLDTALAIEGYDSKKLYDKKGISIVNVKDLERIAYRSILEYAYRNANLKHSIDY